MEEIDKKGIFAPEKLREFWSTGKSIIYKGKKYEINLMCSGDYFLEPANFKGKETDDFSKNTLWLEKTTIKNRYGAKQIVYKIKLEL